MRIDRSLSSALADPALVRLATSGDAAAVETLLRRHQPWIFNLALYMLQVRAGGGGRDPRDLAQDNDRAWLVSWSFVVSHLGTADRRQSRARSTSQFGRARRA